jgi:hypothetical protein
MEIQSKKDLLVVKLKKILDDNNRIIDMMDLVLSEELPEGKTHLDLLLEKLDQTRSKHED